MAESSSPHEDSKSSSDETDKSDQNYAYLGSGRSYECVFCKRGFTTAQALGGHMNIHRKNRAPKTSPSHKYSADHRHHHQDPLVLSKLADDHSQKGHDSFGPFLAIQSYTPLHFGHDHQVHVNYQKSYNSSTSWGTTPRPLQDFKYSQYDDPNDLFRENWRGTALSLAIGAPQHEEDGEDKVYVHDHNNQQINSDYCKDHVELDLELRLGYDP